MHVFEITQNHAKNGDSAPSIIRVDLHRSLEFCQEGARAPLPSSGC